jgi:archaeosine synthase beta-subunit
MSTEQLSAEQDPEATRARTPIYSGMRWFLGRRDLCVSFYTMKCQFTCSYCALPQRSANEPVAVGDLNAQIDGAFGDFAHEHAAIQQISFGNEGSALDPRRFYRESLHHLLDHAAQLPKLEVIAMETRPEYIREDVLRQIQARTDKRLDVTVGFETQDDDIRIRQLNKRISKRIMEERIALLGDLGVRLTSYVMVKPAPGMTDEHGVREAIATIAYLKEVCDRHGVELIAYLTPTYIAGGSVLARTVGADAYTPPTIQNILEVVLGGHELGVKVYTGLWNEGLAGDGEDFTGREGYDPAIRDAIAAFNRTDDFTSLEPYAADAAAAA